MDNRSGAHQPSTSPLGAGLVSRGPDVCKGGLVFAGTRVLVDRLWLHLAGGESLDDFIKAYPTVAREQAARVIELAGEFFAQGAVTDEGSL